MVARSDTHLIIQVAKRLSSHNRAINLFCQLLPLYLAGVFGGPDSNLGGANPPSSHSSTTCRDRWQVDFNDREHWHQVVFRASHE